MDYNQFTVVLEKAAAPNSRNAMVAAMTDGLGTERATAPKITVYEPR